MNSIDVGGQLDTKDLGGSVSCHRCAPKVLKQLTASFWIMVLSHSVTCPFTFHCTST